MKYWTRNAQKYPTETCTYLSRAAMKILEKSNRTKKEVKQFIKFLAESG
jgi:SOS response regulatory protein OraA/RecX